MTGTSVMPTSAGKEVMSRPKSKLGTFSSLRYHAAIGPTERSRIDHAKSPKSSHANSAINPPLV